MRIITKCTMLWDGREYRIAGAEAVDYHGAVALACGATSGQKAIGQQQSAFYSSLQQQMQSVFGNSSTVFNDLIKSFAPIVAAGPSQEGFSAGEKSNLQSQAITETGQAYNNDKQAVGERIAAMGGGNMALPSGAAIGAQLGVANSAAAQTAHELSQINQADYAAGRQNWLTAASGLGQSTNVFDPAVGFANSANNAGQAAAGTQNQIAQANNSWVNAAFGALGQVAGAATGAMVPSGASGASSMSASDSEAEAAYGVLQNSDYNS